MRQSIARTAEGRRFPPEPDPHRERRDSRASYSPETASSRPKQLEDQARRQGVEQGVEETAQAVAPGDSHPDRVLEVAEAVTGEGDGGRDPQDGEAVRAVLKGVARDVAGDEAHQEAEQEPLDEMLAHRRRTGAPQDEETVRALLEPLH